MTNQDSKDEPLPRGGGSISGRLVTPVPKGGSSISGKSVTENPTQTGPQTTPGTPIEEQNHSTAAGAETK